MQWLADFQQWFREPVLGMLRGTWPVLLLVGCAVLGWLSAAGHRRWRGGDGGDFGGSDIDSDGSGDGDGGGD